MKRYSSLVITDTHDRLVSLLERLKKSNDGKYVFKPELTEDYARNTFIDSTEAACFRAMYDNSLISNIWLYVKGNELRVANVVPEKKTNLSISEYNQIISDFYSEFLSIALDDEMFTFIDGNDVKMDSLISKSALEKLNLWANFCNQDNPISHRFDEERWFDFLIALVENKDNLSPNDLIKWLQEDLGWNHYYNPERFVELRNAYEYGLSLIEYLNK